MKLDKMVLINWGAIRNDEYPMGSMTLFTGPTGAGKSTILDALQTIMSAAHANLYNFNSAQEESRQNAKDGKSKRTIWSYVAGAEDNLYARPDGAHGYIAAVFKPSEGEEGAGFTALIGMSARIEGAGARRKAVGERLAMLIIDDAELSIADLATKLNEDAYQVIEVEKIEHHLKARYAKVLNFRDTKKEYLCQLYGRFRGMRTVSFQEASAAAKAWTRSIASTDIGSVDDLVKNQILDFDASALGHQIGQVSDMLRQLHQLRVEGERLRENVSKLKQVQRHGNRAMSAFEKAAQWRLATAKKERDEAVGALEAARVEAARLTQAIRSDEGALDALGAEKKGVQDSLTMVVSKLNGIPIASQKDRLEERIKTAQNTAAAELKALQAVLESTVQVRERARAVAGMKFPGEMSELDDVARSVAAALDRAEEFPLDELRDSVADSMRDKDYREGHSAGLYVATQVPEILPSLEALVEVLTRGENSFTSVAHRLLGELKGRIQRAADREKELVDKKRRLASGQSPLDEKYAYALRKLAEEIPSANPQVLSDLIEPASDDWMSAVEGYMGPNRFNIIVDEKWEAQAIETVARRNLRCRVIQGSKCRKEARPDLLHEDSIVHELRTENPTAWAYLVSQWGGVLKVRTVEQLRQIDRGVMLDGKSAGGRTMSTARTDQLVFGSRQRQRLLEQAIAEHEEAQKTLFELNSLKAQLQLVIHQLSECRLTAYLGPVALGAALNEIGLARNELAQLDLTEVTSLEAERKRLDGEVSRLETEMGKIHQRIGQSQVQAGTQQAIIKAKERALPEREAEVAREREALEALCARNPALSIVEMETEADKMSSDESDRSPQEQQAHLRGVAFGALGDARAVLAEYNLSAKPHERLSFSHAGEQPADEAPYAELVSLLSQTSEQIKMQEGVGMAKNVDELRKSNASFQDAFTKSLCYGIRNAVDDGISTLKELNRTLERLKFGTDRFRIDWSEWVPEFQEYYQFFCAAYEMAERNDTNDLFGTTALDERHCAVRDRLIGLLLDTDQARALKELERIADYRNYRRYEIWKESDTGSRVALSEWGTGSGGQFDTPAYILRAAVVATRLKHFVKGPSLKLLASDESFAKMDERRAHDVLKFMRDGLGIQLLCAMPTKQAGPLKPNFTKEWSFTRAPAENVGEVNFVSDSDERELHPDSLRELWEQRRQQVRAQAGLEFDARFPEEKPATAATAELIL